MKKIISIALLLALCLSLLAGCKADTTGLENAKKYLDGMYKNDPVETAADYTLVGIVVQEGVTYNVDWTCDNAKVIITRNDKLVTIDVPASEAEEIPYVLTATISDDKGNKVTTTFNRKVPAAAGVGLTDEQIVEEAYKLQDGELMDGVSTLTGKITQIKTPYDSGYQNITVIIQIGELKEKRIECYRMKGEGAENLAVGDTITVTGTLKNYGGTIEFDAGCSLDSVTKGQTVTAPTTPAEILAAAYALGTGDSLPYTATLTGVITEISSAWSEQYQNISVMITVEDKNFQCYRIKGEGAATLAVGDTITVTGYLVNYKGDVQFAQGSTLDAVVKGAGGNTNTGDNNNTGNNNNAGTENKTLTVVASPVAGTAYKFGMVQELAGKTVYLKGGMDGYYMATSEDTSAAIDVYLEATTGGYYLYTMEGGAKKYINMVISSTHVNGAYEDTASTVYTYDAAAQTLKADMQPEGKDAAEPYWFGTHNDKTYLTVGPCAVSYEGFYCKFYQ